MRSARQISALGGMLGTPRGLRLVRSEMDSFLGHISHQGSMLSREEIVKLDQALCSLSGAIVDMRRVVTAMLAEAGITSNHVG